jgi:hypothetical protein
VKEGRQVIVMGQHNFGRVSIVKVYYSPTNAQEIVLKTVLKFTLK